MIELTEKLTEPAAAQDTLTLTFELRQKTRLRVRLGSGQEAAVTLPRGTVMRGGELLSGPGGWVVEVVAAPEAVSTVLADDRRSLARAAYHLGNRHVPLQVEDGFVRYQHDHVLDDMVRALGLTVVREQVPFEPEAGAYGHGHAASPHHHHG